MDTNAVTLNFSPPPTATMLTRRKAAAFLKEHGYPISYSTLTKLCSPAIDQGPKTCGRFGRDCLYLPSELLDWARSRLRQ
jgi:hypothetical protein